MTQECILPIGLMTETLTHFALWIVVEGSCSSLLCLSLAWGGNGSCVSAWQHTRHWDEKWDHFTMSCRNGEELHLKQELIKTWEFSSWLAGEFHFSAECRLLVVGCFFLSWVIKTCSFFASTFLTPGLVIGQPVSQGMGRAGWGTGCSALSSPLWIMWYQLWKRGVLCKGVVCLLQDLLRAVGLWGTVLQICTAASLG